MLRPLSFGLFLAFANPANAGPVADFEAQYRDAYASYRAALFTTNSGDAAAAEKATNSFSEKWQALIDAWGNPPPHLENDDEYATTMLAVTAILVFARAQIGQGDLPGAHETLEGVRDLLSDLHARNAIETFSDRMNAYHAEMEHVLASDLSALDDAGIATLRERAAVLDYLARDLVGTPPPGAAGTPEYEALIKAFTTSVQELLTATRAGDAAAIKAAIGGLKKPYARLFLKFG
ncbi:hypothetical protein [Marimonas lutisalis]|uniref:hypothetical protein n=1 Tax=Marimonas lutisalis TaxID=2545756 RepID=UPI0010F823E8|nr:hypothetical protein [Marimonas lutisalis]